MRFAESPQTKQSGRQPTSNAENEAIENIVRLAKSSYASRKSVFLKKEIPALPSEKIEHGRDGIVKMSPEEFQKYCRERLDVFINNLPKIMDILCPNLSVEDKALLAQKTDAIAALLKAKLRLEFQSDGPISYGGGTIYMRSYWNDSGIPKTGVDGVLLHEFFHAVQDMSGMLAQDYYPGRHLAIEGSASLFSNLAIGLFYDGIGKATGRDSYQSFFSLYLINKATDGKLFLEILSGGDEKRIKGVFSTSAVALSINKQILENLFKSSQFDLLNGAAMVNMMPENLAKQYLQSFDSDCAFAPSELYAFKKGLIAAIDEEIRLIGAGPDKLPEEAIVLVQAFLLQILSNGLESKDLPSNVRFGGRDKEGKPIYYECSNPSYVSGMLSSSSTPEAVLFSYSFLRKYLDSSPNQHSKNLSMLIDSLFKDYVFSDRVRGTSPLYDTYGKSKLESIVSSGSPLSQLKDGLLGHGLRSTISLSNDYGYFYDVSFSDKGASVKTHLSKGNSTSLLEIYQNSGSSLNYSDWYVQFAMVRLDYFLANMDKVFFYLSKGLHNSDYRYGDAVTNMQNTMSALSSQLRNGKEKLNLAVSGSKLAYDSNSLFIPELQNAKNVDLDLMLLKGMIYALNAKLKLNVYPNFYNAFSSLFSHMAVGLFYDDLTPGSHTAEKNLPLHHMAFSSREQDYYYEYLNGGAYSELFPYYDALGLGVNINLIRNGLAANENDVFNSALALAGMPAESASGYLRRFKSDCPLLNPSDYMFRDGFMDEFHYYSTHLSDKRYRTLAEAYLSFFFNRGASSMPFSESDYLAISFNPVLAKQLDSLPDENAHALARWTREFSNNYLYSDPDRKLFHEELYPSPFKGMSINSIRLGEPMADKKKNYELTLIPVSLNVSNKFHVTVSAWYVTSEKIKFSPPVEEVPRPISAVSLAQNFPNPFNAETQINFSLKKEANVKIVVSDLLGREITVLANVRHAPGNHYVRLDSTNLPSGFYLYTLFAEGDMPVTKKMQVLK